jgi:hypothetical protein
MPTGAAACFTPEGVYHDGFSANSRPRRDRVRMLKAHFYADARLRMESDPVCDGRMGYARYAFSYFPTMSGCPGAGRVRGHQLCDLDGGLIYHYGEIFERAPVLAKLGFPEAASSSPFSAGRRSKSAQGSLSSLSSDRSSRPSS